MFELALDGDEVKVVEERHYRLAPALLMAWMPPPDGIAMCQCDDC